MPRIVAGYILHYGSDYLPWSVRSVYPFVDRIEVLYSRRPSHGHGTKAVNPETEMQVYESLFKFGDPDKKIHWNTADGFEHEGKHREALMARCMDADLVLISDFDEIWPKELLTDAIPWALANQFWSGLLPFVHFFRSFRWVCRDACQPARLYRPPCFNADAAQRLTRYVPNCGGKQVFHFGYARSPELIKYKMEIHGHKNEWRADWYDDKFMKFPNVTADLHPTCLNFWNAEPFDVEALRPYLADHPNFERALIE